MYFPVKCATNETTRPADTRWPRGFFSPESTGVHILGLHKRSRTAAWNNYKNVVYCHDDDNIANLYEPSDSRKTTDKLVCTTVGGRVLPREMFSNL